MDRAAERGPARGNPCYIIKGDRRFVKEGACRLRGARRKARRRLCPADKKASFYCYLAHFILYLTGIGVQKKQRFSGTRQRIGCAVRPAAAPPPAESFAGPGRALLLLYTDTVIYYSKKRAARTRPEFAAQPGRKGVFHMAHTVMVTGADGFIGSHLTEELVKKGEKVKAFCYYNSFNSCGWIDSLAPEIRSEIEIFMGDIRDPNGVRTAMQGQERVFHLAALIAIPFSYHSPDSYVDTNIKGTLNVLQAARDLGTQRLMVTSTSEVYGTAQYVPIDEKHPYQGQSPYSATKIGADRLAESFYRSFDVPLSIVRPFNTYGPRQSARAVIPTIITQLLAGRTEIRLGSLAPTRDFNYVKDTAAGFMAIADCDAAVGQEINIATGREISIGDLADELIRQINPEARVVCEAERLRPGKSEVERLLGDASKLRALTGWQPAYTFEQGLAQTIEWLRGNMDGYKVDAYNL